jgi:D-alanine-D-alanine ligase-like ATP-grasp enzyme
LQDIACDKEETKMLLEAAEIPVPRGTVIRTEAGLDEAIEKFGYPLVIKPIDGNHGKGNTTNIINREQAVKALEAAKQYGRSVIVEKFITGFDFRVLVINHKFYLRCFAYTRLRYWRRQKQYSILNRRNQQRPAQRIWPRKSAYTN